MGNRNVANRSDSQRHLVEREDSVLVIIDAQDCFLDKYDRAKKQRVVAHIAWLAQAAHHLDVPVVAMAEDIQRSGTLNQIVLDALPPDTVVHDKDFFSLVDNEKILEAVEATGRRTAVCVGTETDVCVAQSAIGLLNHGYRVVVLQDAVASLDSDEEIGIGRMRDAGAGVSSVKAIYYEWLRSISATVSLKNDVPDLQALRPPTLVL